jgi:hypothetical protein
MKANKNKFKDPQGRWLTIGLFKETAIMQKSYIMFTLDEAKKQYLDCRDITGYEYSTKYLGGWQHWLQLKSSPILSPILDQWEDELEIMLRSEAIKKIQELSLSDKGYQAAKYLADKGWAIREAGRPSKEEIARNIKKDEKLYEEFGKNVINLKK